MTQIRRNSILCPNCRKLISSDETICPYCNILRPGSPLKNNVLIRGMADPRNLALYIIWANVIMYIISLIISGSRIGFSMNPMTAFSPSSGGLEILGGTGTIPIDGFGRWWTLLSANYLHASLLHIFFNMLMFWQLAPLASREYGSYRMFSIYTIGGVIGFLVSYLARIPFTIGASAAVCALVGSLLYFGKSRGGVYGQAVYKQIFGWVISLFLFGFFIPGINNWAHGGGSLGGILVGWLLGYTEIRQERAYHKTIALVCAGLTVIVLLWAVFSAFLIVLK